MLRMDSKRLSKKSMGSKRLAKRSLIKFGLDIYQYGANQSYRDA